MSQARSDRPPPAPAARPPERRGLRFAHALIAIAGMAFALPLALIGGMSLLGGLSDNLWLRAGVPLVVLIVVPLVIADRLLPSDPSERRPGLVRDVMSISWAATALAFVGLAGSLTAAPLTAEAARLENDGWTRAAWLGRWMAGPQTAEVDAAEPVLAQADVALTPEPAAPPTTSEPAPKPDADADAATEDANPETSTEVTDAAANTEDEVELTATREYSPAELFTRYAPAVVAIEVDHGGFRSGGTGFFIDDRGTLATNHHVIDGAREVRVKLFDGAQIERVELLASDAEVDLALLRVAPGSLAGGSPEPTVLGDSEAVQVGEHVSVIGNPLGLDHTLTDGIVSARRVYEGERYIQMSAPISPGNSGGPVFDRHGRVIGVSVAHMLGGQNLNLAVPVSQLKAMVADEYPNRRSFGASSW